MAGRMSKLSEDMLPSEKVQELCRAYARGPATRIMLEQCGVGHHNRSISWKYVHSRLRMIVEVDGFSSLRYKYAIAVEPQDSNLLASTKRTQEEVADSGGRFAMVDNQSQIWLSDQESLAPRPSDAQGRQNRERPRSGIPLNNACEGWK